MIFISFIRMTVKKYKAILYIWTGTQNWDTRLVKPWAVTYTPLANCVESYGKPFGFLFSISRYRELFPDIGNLNSRYREINFRYREIINFPISGNDFRISGIDFPISGNVFDFPISGNQFPISENRHPTEAGHFATLQHRPTTPPINNGPQQYRHHRRPSLRLQ